MCAVHSSETDSERQLAVLIDLENVGLDSIQWLFDQISDVGRIIVKRAYADWSSAKNSRDQVLQFGIDPIHLFRSSNSGKNSSDIRLVIDAVDLLYQSPVDTFVIVSSDSDFVPLVSKLRSAGKIVFGAGRKAAASPTLVKSCDRYFYLDQDWKSPSLSSSSKQQGGVSLLVRAIKAAMNEEGIAIGSRLHETLQRLDPSFDFRTLGHSTFTKYLEDSTEVSVTRPRGQGDVTVELAEEDIGVQSDMIDTNGWVSQIDAAWLDRAKESGQSIPGTTAAAASARVLGFSKLSDSSYRTLQKLLDASEILSSRWRQHRNRIIRR